jgi:hypothetical protein
VSSTHQMYKVNADSESKPSRHKLALELKSIGKSPSPKQSLEIFNQRTALSLRIQRHASNTAHFLDLTIFAMGLKESATEDTDGCPEVATLCLPSHMVLHLSQSERTQRVIEQEISLRRAKCVQALQKVRSTCVLKARIFRTRSKHTKGQVNNTRIQNMVTRMSVRIDNSIWEYKTSRRALLLLSQSPEDSARFQSLHTTDVSKLSKILFADTGTGEGYKGMPWFWAFRAGGAEEDDNREALREGEEGRILIQPSGA